MQLPRSKYYVTAQVNGQLKVNERVTFHTEWVICFRILWNFEMWHKHVQCALCSHLIQVQLAVTQIIPLSYLIAVLHKNMLSFEVGEYWNFTRLFFPLCVPPVSPVHLWINCNVRYSTATTSNVVTMTSTVTHKLNMTWFPVNSSCVCDGDGHSSQSARMIIKRFWLVMWWS